VQGMLSKSNPNISQEAYRDCACRLVENHWLFQPSPNDRMTQQHGFSIDELLPKVLSVEGFLRTHFDLPWVNAEEFGEEAPSVLQRIDRLLRFLQGKLTVPAAVAREAIYKIIDENRTQLQVGLPLSMWDRSRTSEDDGDSSVEYPRTILSSRASTFPDGYQILNSSESGICQQGAVELQNLEAVNHEYGDGSKKCGRPPKHWPSSARRLLARFVTTAFPNLTVVEHAVKENGFAVR
jgi:hypothetical protein